MLCGGKIFNCNIILHGVLPSSPFDFIDGPSRMSLPSVSETAGLSVEPNAQQINALLYCLGELSTTFLCSTSISDDECKQFSKTFQGPM